MKLKKIEEILQKQGGLSLLRSYHRTGVLGYSLVEATLLGTSRTSLEILRLAIQNKQMKHLKKNFHEKIVESYVKNSRPDDRKRNFHKNEKKFIWFCWLQGLENAPKIVNFCFNNLQRKVKNREIIVITKENFQDYVKMPSYVLKKWRSGIISNTHFSDLLRIELLYRYGGVWIDSTVWLSGDDLPVYVDDDLFFFQDLKPGRNGKTLFLSSWFLASKPRNPIIGMTRDLLNAYWQENNQLIDYFLFHYFLVIACNMFKLEYEKVKQVSNATPHVFLLNLTKKYNKENYDFIVNSSPIHKLTYKLSDDDLKKEKTNLQHFIFSNNLR